MLREIALTTTRSAMTLMSSILLSYMMSLDLPGGFKLSKIILKRSSLHIFRQSLPEVKQHDVIQEVYRMVILGVVGPCQAASHLVTLCHHPQKLTWKSFPSVGSVAPHRPPHAIGCKGVHPSSAQICVCANDCKIPDHHNNSHHSISLSLLNKETFS